MPMVDFNGQYHTMTAPQFALFENGSLYFRIRFYTHCQVSPYFQYRLLSNLARGHSSVCMVSDLLLFESLPGERVFRVSLHQRQETNIDGTRFNYDEAINSFPSITRRLWERITQMHTQFTFRQ